jgi:hypothetical protein
MKMALEERVRIGSQRIDIPGPGNGRLVHSHERAKIQRAGKVSMLIVETIQGTATIDPGDNGVRIDNLIRPVENQCHLPDRLFPGIRKGTGWSAVDPTDTIVAMRIVDGEPVHAVNTNS